MKNQENPIFKSIFSILEQNSFDIKKVINNFSLENAMPIFKDFFSQNKKPDDVGNHFSSGEVYTKPVANICDAEIMNALNSYLGV